MNIISICAVGIVATVICILLKKQNPEFSMLISIAAGVFILVRIFLNITPAISQINGLLLSTKLSSEYFLILFKALGICFLTQFASDSCKDAGESALSSKIELAGKISIVLISLPLFEKITEISVTLIGGKL